MNSVRFMIFTSFLISPYYLVLPLFYGHSALIFQNPSFVTTFFRIFAANFSNKTKASVNNNNTGPTP